MIIHRFHRGGLRESMLTCREFDSLKECLQTLITEFNCKQSCFKLTLKDIVIVPYGEDMRIGWEDQYMICCASYQDVSDKNGYKLYFGGYEYSHPLQLLGFFATKYSKERFEDEGGTAETVKPTAETSQNVPDDDLIWRKAALQIFFDFAGCIPDTPIGEYQTAYKAYRHKMENLPPVQPKEII